MYAQDQNSKWYVDNGYSRHLIGDKSMFVSLDENKTRNVTLGNVAVGIIRVKGIVSLNNGRGKARDVLFVDGLKHNFLSVSQMCDRGCDVLFKAQDCEIRSTTTRKVLAKGFQTKNNAYILKVDSKEYYIGKQDEPWLWHERLGHINFDHISILVRREHLDIYQR